MNLVDQFVRLKSTPLDPIFVVESIENTLLATACDPQYASFKQVKQILHRLGFEKMSDDDVSSIIRGAIHENLRSKAESDPAAAHQIYADAVAKHPDDLRLRHKLADALYASGRVEAAAVQFAMVADGEATLPARCTAGFALASLLSSAGRPAEALERLAELISAAPAGELGWMAAADALSDMSRDGSKAASDIASLARSVPGQPQPRPTPWRAPPPPRSRLLASAARSPPWAPSRAAGWGRVPAPRKPPSPRACSGARFISQPRSSRARPPPWQAGWPRPAGPPRAASHLTPA